MSVSRLGMAIALSLLSAAPLGAQATKVGYIDSNAVLAEYPPAQEARTALEATLAGFRTEVQQLNVSMQTAVNEYQQQQLTMTAEARQSREQELQNQQDALQRRTQELDNQAQQRQQEIFLPIMEAINAVLEQIRVEGNYAIIFDTASQAILTADPSLELTQEVLRRLQVAGSQPEGGR